MINIINNLIEEPKYNNIIVEEKNNNIGISFYPKIIYQLTSSIRVELNYSLDIRQNTYINKETEETIKIVSYDVNDVYEQQTYVNDVRVTSTTAFEKSFVDAGFAELGKVFTGSILKEEEAKAIRKAIRKNPTLKKVFGKINFFSDIPAADFKLLS